MSELKKEKRQFWIILVIVFLGFLGISIPYLIFPALFLNPSYAIVPESWTASSHAIFLGITLAAYPLGQFFGSPILGSLSDDFGRKKILTTSLFATAICYLITGFAIATQKIWLLIVSRFLSGLMEGNIVIARAIAADMTSLSKHNSFGKIDAVTAIAYLVGPLLGGLMADKSLFNGFSPTVPFYFICFLFVCVTILSMIILKPSTATKKTKDYTIWERFNIIKRVSILFKDERLQFLIITSTFYTLAVDIFFEFGPVYLTVKWALNPSELVIYNGVLSIGIALGSAWLTTLVSSRVSNHLEIMYSIAGFGLFLLGMVLSDSRILMLGLFAVSGIVIGCATTLITIKISNTAPEKKQGEVMGVQTAMRVLGDAMICLFGGVLLLISPKIILFMAAILAFIAVIYFFQKRNKRSIVRQ